MTLVRMNEELKQTKMLEALQKFTAVKEELVEKMGEDFDLEGRLKEVGLTIAPKSQAFEESSIEFGYRTDWETPTNFILKVKVQNNTPVTSFIWNGNTRWTVESLRDLVILRDFVSKAADDYTNVKDIVDGNATTVTIPGADGADVEVNLKDLMAITGIFNANKEDNPMLNKTSREDMRYLGKELMALIRGNEERKTARVKLSLGCESFDVSDHHEEWFTSAVEMINKAIEKMEEAIESLSYLGLEYKDYE